ncbi:MAG: hypothetical protein RQ899_11300 [Pseudomonadales bacterium]|nr:hypothetical protein [Pseudomonadales bacterium]
MSDSVPLPRSGSGPEPESAVPETSVQGQFQEVFQAELGALKARRLTLRVPLGEDVLALPNFDFIYQGQASDVLINTLSELSDSDETWTEARAQEGVETGLIGVALSGGGIRSSTFNLGVLQAIQRAGLFPCIDYLSTVSGGGYIGTYLGTVIAEDQKGDQKGDQAASETPTSDSAAENQNAAPQDLFPLIHHTGVEESPRFRHLRNHANFLAPDGKAELLSIPVLLLRGLLVNTLFILPFFIAISLLFGWLMAGTRPIHYWAYDSLWETMMPSWAGFADGSFLHYIPLTLAMLCTLLLLFALYPLVHWYRSAVLHASNSQTIAVRHRSLKALCWLFGGSLLVFFIELQPLVLQYLTGNKLNAWFAAVLGTALAAIPFCNKIINILAEIKAKLGAAAYGLVGVVCLWLLLLWMTTLAMNVNWTPPFQMTPDLGNPLLWLGVLLLLAVYAQLFVDVNATSIHKFYRDQLVKAFVAQATELEASRAKAVDDAGSLKTPRLSELDTIHAPYHLINVAVNARRSEARYKSGRQAGFFFFSPLYCGGIRSSYIKTRELERLAVDLDAGTAMAISGAAVAPNMGRFSNPLLAFVLAILNVRLNYWLPNPRRVKKLLNAADAESATERSGNILERSWQGLKACEFTYNKVGPVYLLREMLQWLSTDSRFLNLSDGGHIENLGVYELLRRQCRLIIAGDGEADPQLSFDGLAEVIRLARIDFGFRIDMHGLDEIRSGEQQFALGTIHYSNTRTGKLIYIKSNLGGDYNLQATLAPDLYRSSADRDDNLRFDDNAYVAHYRHRHPDFPQESTADQFFDESQFESYRALGYQTAASVLIRPERHQTNGKESAS